jgi:DNA-binding transcriptional regulator YiaG
MLAFLADTSLMANVASVLREEISRIARKEIRRETGLLKKSAAAHRAEIAALKRRVVELERQLRRSGKSAAGAVAASTGQETIAQGTRFSAKSMASQRRRLGLSAAECGLLVGASAQSVYNWEEGKARPRARHLPAIFALRTLGRRQANEILETRKAA